MKTRPFTLLCATLLGATSQTALADTLVDNVDGMTIDEAGQLKRFTGLIFDENTGKIIRTLARGEERPTTDYGVDGQGRVMMPGMIDSHVNVMEIGFAALTLDLSDAVSLEDALSRIAQFSQDNPGRPWILGRGWDHAKWGLDRFPTASDLDGVVTDRPIWLQNTDGDAFWANSEAMKRAEITASTKSAFGGQIVKSQLGEPSGIFIGRAAELFSDVLPRPRPVDRIAAFTKAQNTMLAKGVTALSDMGTTIADWQTFRRAGDLGQLKLRIMSYANNVEALELIGGIGPTPWLYGGKLRLNGLSLTLDGGLSSRAASLKSPYSDQPDATGLTLLKPAELRNLMSRAALDDFQTAVAATGDAANEEVVNAIAELTESYKGDRRWRVENASVIARDDIQRIIDSGVIVSMQPAQLPQNRKTADNRLGADRVKGAYAWRSISSSGGRLAFGSSAPAQMPDPFSGIAIAISRTDASGEPFGGWQSQESLNRESALAAFTANAAYAGFAEGRFGRLVPGEYADFIFVDRDLTLSSPAEIRETRVLEVWIGGQRAR